MKDYSNPYRRQEVAASDSEENNHSQWCLPLGEFVIVAAIIGGLMGLLVPAVEQARSRKGHSSIMPQSLKWIINEVDPKLLLFLMIAGPPAAAFCLFWGLRSIAPAWLLPSIPWWKKTKRRAMKGHA